MWATVAFYNYRNGDFPEDLKILTLTVNLFDFFLSCAVFCWILRFGLRHQPCLLFGVSALGCGGDLSSTLDCVINTNTFLSTFMVCVCHDDMWHVVLINYI